MLRRFVSVAADESGDADEVAFLVEKGIHLTAAPEVLSFLIQRGFHPHLGARPLRDVIEKHVRDAVAVAVMKNVRFAHAEIIVHGINLALKTQC